MSESVEYVPVLTTCFATVFLVIMVRHYRVRKTLYLLWWTIGILTFALGTLTESINALAGWSEVNLRIWYIVGALLGGFPLAQGSVYLLMNKRFADITTVIFVSIILIAAMSVCLSPIVIPEGFTYKLTGKVLGWTWVRYFSPLINIYSLIFLVGGAIYSANRYFRQGDQQERFKGNIFIAIGGLLPGIGGSFTRMGYVNVLYVTEFAGLVLIYVGYRIIRNQKMPLAA